MQIPKEWTFKSDEIAANFNAHVNEQLPWYPIATGAVSHIARHYLPQYGRIYDIGASTGNIGRALEDLIDDRCAEFIPIDSSEEMREHYKSVGELIVADATEFHYEEFDIAVCFLTLMFLSPIKQIELIATLRKNARSGGAIIIVDKCKPCGGYPAVVMSRMAMAAKLANAADPIEVLRKELSLSGVQRPICPSILGDDAVEFFRFGDFAGWVIET
jgi:tRNA (cmo5U34)-methyltransferase